MEAGTSLVSHVTTAGWMTYSHLRADWVGGGGMRSVEPF